MDTSDQYIKMCERAGEIQKRMFDLPVYMNAGDFIWDGKRVFVLGQDFIGLEKVYSSNRVPLLYVAMMKRGRLLYTIDKMSEPDLSIAFEKCEYEITTLGNPCWLLRQDQLQEMVGYQLHWLIILFNKWVQNGKNFKYGVHNSMEQLWLAFVMKEKYGKIWDGEKWTNSSAVKR